MSGSITTIQKRKRAGVTLRSAGRRFLSIRELEGAKKDDRTDEAAGGCGVSERGNVSSLH